MEPLSVTTHQDRFILNQAGFSMAGVLVALGLVALLSLGIAGMLSGMNRETKAMSAKLNKIGLAQDLRTLMAESSTCTNVFAGGGQTLTIDPNSQTNLRGNLGAAGTVAEGQELRQYGVRVKRFYARNPVSAGAGPGTSRLFLAEVFLEAEELGPANDSRSFKASSVGFTYFELPAASTVIQRCYSLENQADLLETTCLKLKGVFNSATRECDTLPTNCARLGGQWSPATGTCNTLPNNCARMGGAYNASNDTCKLSLTPQETCASLGGTYKDGKCGIDDPSQECRKLSPSSSTGIEMVPSGYVDGGLGGSNGCGRTLCVNGNWVPISAACPTPGEGT